MLTTIKLRNLLAFSLLFTICFLLGQITFAGEYVESTDNDTSTDRSDPNDGGGMLNDVYAYGGDYAYCSSDAWFIMWGSGSMNSSVDAWVTLEAWAETYFEWDGPGETPPGGTLDYSYTIDGSIQLSGKAELYGSGTASASATSDSFGQKYQSPGRPGTQWGVGSGTATPEIASMWISCPIGGDFDEDHGTNWFSGWAEWTMDVDNDTEIDEGVGYIMIGVTAECESDVDGSLILNYGPWASAEADAQSETEVDGSFSFTSN